MSSLVNYIQPARFHSFDYAESESCCDDPLFDELYGHYGSSGASVIMYTCTCVGSHVLYKVTKLENLHPKFLHITCL